jgi:ribosomal protein L11 methyltransferase
MRWSSANGRKAGDGDIITRVHKMKIKSEIFKCTVGAFSIVEAFEVADLLFEMGYMSVSCIEKKDKWYVEILSEKPIIASVIFTALHKYECSSVEMEKILETDWLKKSFESFKQIVVGNFYLFGPHLRTNVVPKDKIKIEIAAATAFGTGEHPTTNRCLVACQEFFDEKVHKLALDIGCGSCILSIALAKLGAREVIACDNDSEAVSVSLKNIKANCVAHKISVFQNKETEFSHRRYDFIVANILETPLVAMSAPIVDSLNRGGILVLSGFDSKNRSVMEKYKSLGMSEKYVYNHENWITTVLHKK